MNLLLQSLPHRYRRLVMLVGLMAVLSSHTTAWPASPTPLQDARTTTPHDGNPRTVYFSVGDNQHALLFPLDSPATIQAAFDAVQRSYNVGRVWWRGGQIAFWASQFIIREENRLLARLWHWWKKLSLQEGTDRLAVAAAHARGMEIWMTGTFLFDHGSAPDVGFVGLPYVAESRFRIEHPEWIPVNRFGTWRQGGAIEYAYPEARRAVLEALVSTVVSGGYDGLAILTYAENYSLRYEDEFGYNAPVVDEFRRRYGVDIRTQPFDKAAWARLRGEYVTTFLRELHTALGLHGKKLAVSVDGKDPHWPMLLNVAGGVRSAGRIQMDIETWLREGIVDELTLFANATDESIRRCLEAAQGTTVRVSVFRTRGELPMGAPRVMWIGTDIESGFAWEQAQNMTPYVSARNEVVPVQPMNAMQSQDKFAQRRLLTAVIKGKQTLPVEAIVQAAKNADVYVRRLAIRALETLNEPSALTALEAALQDPENSVRCLAAVALARLPHPRTVERLLEAVARDNSTFQFNYVAVPAALQRLAKQERLGPAEKSLLLARVRDQQARVREVVLYLLRTVGAPQEPDGGAEFIRLAHSDPNPYVRELALINLKSTYGPTPAVLDALIKAMHTDQDATVQVSAATALTIFRIVPAPNAARTRALRELTALFRGYGTGSQRSDLAWGWRHVGNAMLQFAPEGRDVLERLMAARKEDVRLADLAWRVVYLRQSDTYERLTEAEDYEAHAALRRSAGPQVTP